MTILVTNKQFPDIQFKLEYVKTIGIEDKKLKIIYDNDIEDDYNLDYYEVIIYVG